MRIVYFGTPQFAVPTLRRLLASSHTVVGVVTQPDRPRGRGQKVSHAPVKALALEHGVPVYQPSRLREPVVAETLRVWQPDLGVVAAYGRLIPDDLLALPRLGMINVHGSLLPKYRGAAPVHRAVIDGETATGVTIMRVVTELDAGDMLATVTHPIGPDDTSEAVEHALSELGAALLVEVVDRLTIGPVEGVPQDSRLATYAQKITRDDGLIDWALPAVAIHNRVRGLYPWPHAFTYLDSARLIILKTRVVEGVAPGSPAAPGTIVGDSRDAIHVAAGPGTCLAIEQLQPEGRKPMTAREFLSGRALPSGSRLSRP